MNGKLVAPVVITAILAFCFFSYAILCAMLPIPFFLKLMGLLISFSLMGVSIYVLVERIQEIRSGEEDDLSNY